MVNTTWYTKYYMVLGNGSMENRHTGTYIDTTVQAYNENCVKLTKIGYIVA